MTTTTVEQHSTISIRPVTGIVVLIIAAAHIALGTFKWTTARLTGDAAIWFTAFGVLAIALGLAIVELERRLGYPPLGVTIALVVVLGYGLVTCGPVSGFPALLVPIVIALYRRFRRPSRAL